MFFLGIPRAKEDEHISLDNSADFTRGKLFLQRLLNNQVIIIRFEQDWTIHLYLWKVRMFTVVELDLSYYLNRQVEKFRV